MFADIDDLFEVQSALHDVAPNWRGLGEALRLRPAVLRTIEADKSDCRSRLREALTEWLQQAYNTERFGPPSWKMLVAAVAHPSGGNNNALAQQIASKYNGRCAVCECLCVCDDCLHVHSLHTVAPPPAPSS